LSISLLLVDDHKIVLEGLKALIEKQENMKVIGVAPNGREAVTLAQELSPDIIIMDLSMPDMNGIDATIEIIKENPSQKVLALSMHSDKRFISKALRGGAAGYMLKDCASEELVQAIKDIISGRSYLSPQIADIVFKDYREQLVDKEFSAFSKLTKREREVLQFIAEGKSTKNIAASLNLSVKTIETHRAQIMLKLDLHSVAELTKFALREGLTSIE
jgi:DNA-binding NarL/FixJ family response regulator